MSKPELLPVPLIKELNYQPYDSVLPTAFNEAPTLLEKVNMILQSVNESGKLTNEMIKKWNEVITWVLNDGLTEAIRKKLEEWLEDGTLEKLVGEVFDDLLAMKADLSYTNKRLQEIIVNVKIFGAKGDGINNDSPATQQALDYVTSLPQGGTILFPSGGNYSMQAELVVRKNTRILATGATITRNHTGYMIINGLRTDLFSTYNGNGNITIDGGLWNAQGQNGGGGSIFTFGHANGLTVKNATLMDACRSHAIEFNSSQNILVDNCKFLGCVDPQDEVLFTEAVQLDIAKPGFGLYAIGYHDNTTCKNVVIQNSTFDGSGNAGSRPWGTAIGTHSATVGFYMDNIRIQNNFFNNLTIWGVRAYSYKNLTIENNIFTNCRGGIMIETISMTDPKDTVDGNMNQTNASQPVKNIRIKGNRFMGIYGYHTINLFGLEQNGDVEDVIVSENLFETQTGDGQYSIKGTYVKNAIIKNNISKQSTSNGFGFSYCKEVKIFENHINYAGRHGIYVDNGSTNMQIQNNEILNCQYDGVALTENITNSMVTGNKIRNASRVESGTRNGIGLSTGVENTVISGNSIGGTTTLFHGITITSSCKNIYRTNNFVFGNFSSTPISDTSIEKSTISD